MNYEFWFWVYVVWLIGYLLITRFTLVAHRKYSKVLGSDRDIWKRRAEWYEDTAHKYEELRELIDDGSESMTHEDAVEEVNRLRKSDDDSWRDAE